MEFKMEELVNKYIKVYYKQRPDGSAGQLIGLSNWCGRTCIFLVKPDATHLYEIVFFDEICNIEFVDKPYENKIL